MGLKKIAKVSNCEITSAFLSTFSHFPLQIAQLIVLNDLYVHSWALHQRGGNCIQSGTLIFCVNNTKSSVPLLCVLQSSITDHDQGLKQQLAM